MTSKIAGEKKEYAEDTTIAQLERYSRHIILKEVGVKGQKRLLNAKVLIIGAGGLGSPADSLPCG